MAGPETATASAYVKEGRLCILGVSQTSMGPVPFAYHADVGKDIPDGPVDLDDVKVSQAVDESREPIAAMIHRSEMGLAAKSLVERARHGDQNAMAVIREVGVNAKRGSKRAKKAFQTISRYIERNPADAPPRPSPIIRSLGSAIAGESDHHYSAAITTLAPSVTDPYVAALMIANGPKLDEGRVKQLAARFGNEDAFKIGWHSKKPLQAADRHPDMRDAIYTGCVVRLAHTLQGVRSGELPVSRLCPIAGWELGE